MQTLPNKIIFVPINLFPGYFDWWHYAPHKNTIGGSFHDVLNKFDPDLCYRMKWVETDKSKIKKL